MRREVVYSVIKFIVSFTILVQVLLFLIGGSFLVEKANIPGFGNLNTYFFDQSKLWIVLLFALIELGALLICLLYFRVYKEDESITSLGLLFPLKKNILSGMLLGGIAPFCILVAYMTDGSPTISVESLSLSTVLYLIAIFLVISFVEELIFRGYVLNTLLKVFSPMVSTIVASVLFAIIHIPNTDVTPLDVLNVFLGGCLLSLLFFYSKHLWMPIAFHLTWNLSLFVAFYLLNNPTSGFYVDENSKMNDHVYTWIPTVILPLIIAVFIYLIHKRKTRDKISKERLATTVQ